MSETKHAELSPSSAARWMACPGSVALCRGLPDSGSPYAATGTAMHSVAEMCLTQGAPAAAFIGRVFVIDGYEVEFTPDLAVAVQTYLNFVDDLRGDGDLMIEQRLDISSITLEADARGTSDVVIVRDRELIICDLKGGMGEPVDAEGNPQLQIYALAAMREFELSHEFDTVRMAICQPRLNSNSEWVQTCQEMEAFAERVKDAALATRLVDAPLFPGEKQCRWCRAKGTCPKLTDAVLDVFDVVDPPSLVAAELSYSMGKVPLVELWCKGIRAETEKRLLDGQAVVGFKLVQGKRGNRAWTSKDDAESLLKTMRVPHDQMYDYSVISPTSAEKLAKAEVIGPRQWPKLQQLITQSEGSPSVAPESDKRPALVLSATADDFETLT